MSYLNMAWCIGVGPDKEGGNLNSPTWDEISRTLNCIRSTGGAITIEIMDGPSPGPQHLQVQTEGGNFIVMLGEDGPDEEWVRTFEVPEKSGEVPIGGYMWDARTVVQDLDLVVRVFKEFFETGDVSKELLR